MTLVAAVERFAAVLSLIFLNAFFVAAEFSILSVRRSRISQLAQAGDVNARTVERLQSSLERLLSSTQIGITLSSLALGWIGEETVGETVSWLLRDLSLRSVPLAERAYVFSVPIAFCFVAYLQIVLGELCPKALALRYPEPMARSLGPFSWSIARFFQPLIFLLNQSTRLLLRLNGVHQVEAPGRLTAEELQLIIQTQSASGLESQARQMLSNVLEFSELTAVDVMVPRPDVVTLTADGQVGQFLETLAQTEHDSYPVVEESIDDVVGIVHLKVLATALLEGNMQLTDPLRPWIRAVQFVPEQMPLHELHRLMQQTREKLVIVVDEYGGTAGLVSLADLAREILDLDDPRSPQSTPGIQQLNPDTYHIQAQRSLEEVNERLGLSLPVSEEYTTIGGFLISLLQQVPEVGQAAHYDNLEFTVVSTEGRRLNILQIRRHGIGNSTGDSRDNGTTLEPE